MWNKTKKRKSMFSICIAVTLILGLFAAMPQAASAATNSATIDVSRLGGSTVFSEPGEAQWQYSAGAFNVLYLKEAGADYTLTGSNGNLEVQVTNAAANASITMENASITAISSGSPAFYVDTGTECSMILVGSNTLVSNTNQAISVYSNGGCVISSNSSGTLVARAPTGCGIMLGTPAQFGITGSAFVTAEGRNGAVWINDNILMGDGAALTMINNTANETHTFVKTNPASTFPWELTNAALTSGAVTGATIEATVAANTWGTVALPNPTPQKTSITKITAGKKQMKVTWKKLPASQKVTKYQLRYRVKGTSKWTTKTYAATKSAATIKNLKKGKRYQVQVGSYRTLYGAKYQSAWSAIKTGKKIK